MGTYPTQFHLAHSDRADQIAKDFLVKFDTMGILSVSALQIIAKA
jgi:hypothetical protein